MEPRSHIVRRICRYWLVLVQVGMLAILLGEPPSASAATTHQVKVEDDEFLPKVIAIAPGDTVVWTNNGSDHTVIADDGSFSSTSTGDVSIPPGATFSHTFQTIGRYPYYCQLHGGAGGQDMAGVVRVVDSTSNRPPAKPINVAPSAGAGKQSTSLQLKADAFSDPDAGDLHLASEWVLRDMNSGQVVLSTGEDANNLTSLQLSDLAPATTYGWVVRYRDDRGAWSAFSDETLFTTIAAQAANGTGLAASYGSYKFKSDTMKVTATQVDPTISFDWGQGKPNSSTPANNFFVRWEGSLLPEFSEPYRFRVRADGGVRLWINGAKVLDDWVPTPFAVHRNVIVPLEASIPISVKMEYFDTTGEAAVSLRWSSRSRPLETVPQNRLFPTAP
jgi:plastocyanin